MQPAPISSLKFEPLRSTKYRSLGFHSVALFPTEDRNLVVRKLLIWSFNLARDHRRKWQSSGRPTFAIERPDPDRGTRGGIT
ncbi:hypothetical protein [Pelagerythrobacter aerophilus]